MGSGERKQAALTYDQESSASLTAVEAAVLEVRPGYAGEFKRNAQRRAQAIRLQQKHLRITSTNPPPAVTDDPDVEQMGKSSRSRRRIVALILSGVGGGGTVWALIEALIDHLTHTIGQ